MPVYEFYCEKCNKKFEQLCRINWEGAVKCPFCANEHPSKVLSAFSSPGSGGSGCGSCSSHNCGSCK